MLLNLSWITDELAIGGCFPSDSIAGLVEHRVAAVVDVRGEACDDDSLLAHHGIAFLHLPTRDHCAVSAAMLRQGIAFVTGYLDTNQRVLVHCQFGIGRSALLVLCVLVARGHAPLAALELAKSKRACVCPSPAQFEGWAAWLRAHADAQVVTWQVPSFAAYAEIAYRPR
jgi:protein-tyrosine phosphatase